MSKIAGFTLTKAPNVPLLPPWLRKYPHLTVEEIQQGGWSVVLWGTGDLTQFVEDDTILVGYSEVDKSTLDIYPLQNRGLLLKLGEKEATVTNDALGMMQVFYGSKAGVPYVSTCEEVVIKSLGAVTLSPGRLVGFLMLQSTSASLTLWNEIDKLYANSVLHISKNSAFEQTFQAPLNFLKHNISKDPIKQMALILRETVERYTDPLEDVFLLLSHGHDSRLLLLNMNRPECIHARTFPLSHPAERAYDVVIARQSAKLAGVKDHAILDLEQNQLRDCTRSSIEFYGTALGAVQIYLYDVCERIGLENREWPIITGLNGDESAGIAIGRSRSKLQQESAPADRFVSGCYSWVKAWLPQDLDELLTFDWKRELEPIRNVWAHFWEHTEGDDLTKHAQLIHTRNRGNQYITYAWQACDLYGGMVGPIFNDRHYIEFMLSLPHDVLSSGAFSYDVSRTSKVHEKRTGQVELFRRFFPQHYPNAGLPFDAYDWTNRLDLDALIKARDKALWPLTSNGAISHDFFKQSKLKELYKKAVAHDMRSYYLLNSIQPIAWAIQKGYVR